MKRDYSNQKLDQNEVRFFYGREVEKTPAYSMNTLFVVGIQPILDITNAAGKLKTEHMFLVLIILLILKHRKNGINGSR